MAGASILIFSGDPALINLLNSSKYSLELSGKVAPSSQFQPTIIISAPMLSAYDKAIEVKTVFLAGTQTLLALSLLFSMSSNSSGESSGMSSEVFRLELLISANHGRLMTSCCQFILLHMSFEAFNSLLKLFWP